MSEAALVVSADVPWPPDGGGRIASLRVIEAVASGYEIDLLALGDPAIPVDLAELRNLCRSVEVVDQPFTFGKHPAWQLATAARSLYSLDPYRIVKFRNRRLRDLVQQRVGERRYAVVHYEQLGVAPLRVASLPSTLSHQNVEAHLYSLGARHAHPWPRRVWAQIEALKLARTEPRLLRDFDHLLVLSEHDRRLLERPGLRRVSVVPLPVLPAGEVPPPPSQPTVLTLGTMSWFGVEDGLLWFAGQVWPRIREKVPGARWTLVGANPGPRVRAMHGQDGIDVHGYAADLQEIVSRSRVLVVPLFIGGGVRVKLLETMAQGRPFVATPVGALGLSLEEGTGGFVREGPEQFAAATVALLLDDEAWTRAGASGMRFVELHHAPANARQVVLAALEQARAHHGRGAPE